MSQNKLEKQKVLVTGANGFIGSHLCFRLFQRGFEVHAVSRSKLSTQNGIRWWQNDLSNSKSTLKLLKTVQPDIILHLASHVVGDRDIKQAMPTVQGNLFSTLNLMIGACEIGCKKVVLAGSMEEPDLKTGNTIPSSPYAAAKWASTGYAQMFHALYQLPVTILRIFMVYGPAQRDVKKLIPYVINSLLRKEAPKLSNGRRKVDWIFVDDVVDAFLAAIETSKVEGKLIDVGSGNLVSVQNIVERLHRLIAPEIDLTFGEVPERPMEQVRVANTQETHDLLRWKPKTSLEDGLKQTIESYKNKLQEEILI